MAITTKPKSGSTIEHPQDLIDVSRYPLPNPSSTEYTRLIEHCRQQLKATGACVLPGFVNQSALDLLVQEAIDLAPLAFHSTVEGNAYLTPVDDSAPANHPLSMVDKTALAAVAYDQIPPGALLRLLYEWDGLKDFLRDALSKKELFRYADKMGALNIAVMKEGDYLRWHFDQTDFVVSLLIQDCQSGGDYEFVPMIRSAENENYDAVRAILSGSRDGVVRLNIEPGSLVLFEGRNSLHRVTAVEGSVVRLIALLGYDTKPGTISTDHLRYMRYGRID